MAPKGCERYGLELRSCRVTWHGWSARDARLMLYLYSVYLMPGEGQPAAYAASPIFDSREFF